MSIPGDHRQQGLPLGHQRPLPRRPDDPGRRRRRRRRRRHGVDDERAVPAPRSASRVPNGQRRDRRLDDPRRPLVRVRRRAHGHRDREVLRRDGRASPARRMDEMRCEEPRAGRGRPEGRPVQRRDRRSRDPAAQGRPAWSSSPTRVSAPEPRPESLGGLRPAFGKDGTITAGNASQISDGGAAVVMTSREKAEELGVSPLAELVGFGMVAGPDASLLTQPSRAIKRALDRSAALALRRRPLRAQRGVRRRRRRVDGATSGSPTT